MDPIEKKAALPRVSRLPNPFARRRRLQSLLRFLPELVARRERQYRRRSSPPSRYPISRANTAPVGVAWTYNEPFIWYEYIMDAGRRVKEAGLINVLVTNGYVNPEPLEEMRGLIDAMNIDLKAIDDSFYRKNCKGRVDPVLETIRIAELNVPRGSHQSHYSRTERFRRRHRPSRRFRRLRQHRHPPALSPDIFPIGRSKRRRRPKRPLSRAFQTARERLSYVYLGNVTLESGNDTHCPRCGALLVSRRGYDTRVVGLTGNACVGL